MIKVITDFGIKELQPKRIKSVIKGHAFTVCDVPTQYMNASEPLMMRRVVHIATGTKLPFDLHHRQTLADGIRKAADFLDKISDEQLSNELSKYEILNAIN